MDDSLQRYIKTDVHTHNSIAKNMRINNSVKYRLAVASPFHQKRKKGKFIK